jgi:hypothetical protein
MADLVSLPVQVFREDVLASQRWWQFEGTSLTVTAELQKQSYTKL